MKGFTLIELIVAIGVSLVLSGFIIANYNNYNDIQTLRQAGLTLKNDLRYAQSKALNGEKPQTGCTTLAGFRVFYNATRYWLRAECTPEGYIGMITTQLPASIQFDITNSETVLFTVLSRGTNKSRDVPFTLTGFGKSYVIVVSPNGDINDLGLQE